MIWIDNIYIHKQNGLKDKRRSKHPVQILITQQSKTKKRRTRIKPPPSHIIIKLANPNKHPARNLKRILQLVLPSLPIVKRTNK